jgi:hypothetical protein
MAEQSEAMDSMDLIVGKHKYDLANLPGKKKAELLASGEITEEFFPLIADGIDPNNVPGRVKAELRTKSEENVDTSVVYQVGDRVKFLPEKIVTEVLEVRADGSVIILNNKGKKVRVTKLSKIEKINVYDNEE